MLSVKYYKLKIQTKIFVVDMCVDWMICRVSEWIPLPNVFHNYNHQFHWDQIAQEPNQTN